MGRMTEGWPIRLEQMAVMPGDPRRNTETMLAAIAVARRDGVRVLAFPEMAIPGYLLGDEWERPAFLRECVECGEIVRAAARDLIVIFGNVAVDPGRRNEDGRVRKYNALFVAAEGRFLVPENGLPYPFVVKTLMPNYREFDDSRHFFDNRKLAQERGCPVADLIVPLNLDGRRVGMLLCEDAWDSDYAVAPARILVAKGAEALVNISCSPFTANKGDKRNRIFSALARQLGRPLFYVNNVGIQDNGKTVYTFDGGSTLYDAAGGIMAGPAPFSAGCLTIDGLPPAGPVPAAACSDTLADVDRALVYGIGRFCERLGIRRVVVGISGGIDSAVVAALHRRVFDSRDMLLLSMPSRFNSQRTRNLARRLAGALGCLFAEVPIDDSVAQTRRQLDGLDLCSADGRLRERLMLNEAMMENVQARDRSARLLAAAAAAFGGVFTCNANKAELTVGYTTLYGDLGGYLAPIADLWKGEVYQLARGMNTTVFGREVIPEGCFTVTPSAELSAAQDVEQGCGDPLMYPYHDALFRVWVESWDRVTPEEILAWYQSGELAGKIGYPGDVAELFASPQAFVADLERWWNAYQGPGVAKRIQAPPVLAVKRRAFGFDHREAQLGPRYTQNYREMKQRLGLAEAPTPAAARSPQAVPPVAE